MSKLENKTLTSCLDMNSSQSTSTQCALIFSDDCQESVSERKHHDCTFPTYRFVVVALLDKHA